MDFFHHYPPITTQVSVEIVDDDEFNPPFFDRVNVGSEDLKRLVPGTSSDFAISITAEPIHPTFLLTGLICWVAPHDSKVRREIPLVELLMYDPLLSHSMGVPCVSPLHHCGMLSGHRS